MQGGRGGDTLVLFSKCLFSFPASLSFVRRQRGGKGHPLFHDGAERDVYIYLNGCDLPLTSLHDEFKVSGGGERSAQTRKTHRAVCFFFYCCFLAQLFSVDAGAL